MDLLQSPHAPPAAELLPHSLLARWQQRTTEPGSTVVLPDGCCDLILHVDGTGQPDWHVSPLADAAVTVPGAAHEFWRGYRLRPGTVVQAPALIRAAQAIWSRAVARDWGSSAPERIDHTVEQQLLEAIDTHTHQEARVQEALHTLAHAATVAGAARSLGVSERSLERLTRATTRQPPSYWRALARVRRAAQALGGGEALAGIAADHGYADQAHFSRDCLRWLGQSPSLLRRSPGLLATVAQAGYG
ncbi:helix-turn-helix domain-containing protein [Acidovorax sp. LjRoot129]|uniref:AraC family transcriptional regulator n=1 Tax=Acidovorax sp. LjRoot129 TaxID=3342260 RepID=UPI003ECD00C0